jgi:hypothetical protein
VLAVSLAGSSLAVTACSQAPGQPPQCIYSLLTGFLIFGDPQVCARSVDPAQLFPTAPTTPPPTTTPPATTAPPTSTTPGTTPTTTPPATTPQTTPAPTTPTTAAPPAAGPVVTRIECVGFTGVRIRGTYVPGSQVFLDRPEPSYPWLFSGPNTVTALNDGTWEMLYQNEAAAWPFSFTIGDGVASQRHTADCRPF